MALFESEYIQIAILITPNQFIGSAPNRLFYEYIRIDPTTRKRKSIISQQTFASTLFHAIKLKSDQTQRIPQREKWL